MALKIRYDLLKGMEIHLPSQPFIREYAIRIDIGYIPISDIIIHMAKFFMGAFVLMFVLSLTRLVLNN